MSLSWSSSEPPKNMVFWALKMPFVVIFILLPVLGFICTIYFDYFDPTPTTYDRMRSPNGQSVAIVGSRQDAIDPFDRNKAVWISRPGAPESEWSPVLGWRQRDVHVHWVSDERLIVESQPVHTRTIPTWNGITIEFRKLASQ